MKMGTIAATIAGSISNGGGSVIVNADGSVSVTPASGTGLLLGVSPPITAQRGLLSLGNGPIDGVTAGHFNGNTNGTVLAANAASGYAGDLLHLQIAGLSALQVDSARHVIVPFQLWVDTIEGNSAGVVTVASIIRAQIGSSGTFAPTVGVANIQTGSVGNTAGTLTTLFSYNLPANSLDVAAKSLRIRAHGTFAANANSKTINLLFGGVAIAAATTTTSGGAWAIEAVVVKTGASAQSYAGLTFPGTASPIPSAGTATQTDTAIIAVAVQGNGVGAGDVAATLLLTEYLS